MNQVLPLYLHKLPHLAELFSHFNAGRHLNRFSEAALWVELEQEREAYTRLFAALGYELRIDERGFAWFHTDEAGSNVSKTTRQLALLFMLIFEYQADAGLNLGRFTEWALDATLLDALIEKNAALLEAEELAERERLESLLRSASNYGFVLADNARWYLQPAVFRYLDHFEALAGRTQTAEEGGEPPFASEEPSPGIDDEDSDAEAQP